MADQPAFGPWPIVADPDLAPDVFWIVDGDGLPLGIGQIPPESDAKAQDH